MICYGSTKRSRILALQRAGPITGQKGGSPFSLNPPAKSPLLPETQRQPLIAINSRYSASVVEYISSSIALPLHSYKRSHSTSSNKRHETSSSTGRPNGHRYARQRQCRLGAEQSVILTPRIVFKTFWAISKKDLHRRTGSSCQGTEMAFISCLPDLAIQDLLRLKEAFDVAQGREVCFIFRWGMIVP